MAADLALVVGLGNPGAQYERTRHNVGFRVIDVLMARLGATLRPHKGLRALTAETRDGDQRLVLAEPTTYMNLSGEAVAPLARYFKVDPADIVVVHDETEIPFGEIRVKSGGGSAGHNGIESVTRSLGTPDYPRVRVGVGRPPGRMALADWVLSPFPKADEEQVGVLVHEAADAALMVIHQGIDAAQNRYHAPRLEQ